MRSVVFQPPYPGKGESLACLAWEKDALDSIERGSADLIVLPENSNCTGAGTKEEMLDLMRGAGADLVANMKQSACRIGALLLAGVMTEDAHGVLRNQLMMVTPDGKTTFPYTKNHCVQPELDKGIVPGDKAELFEYNGIRIGAAICFDFYFTELFTRYAALRSDLIVIVSHQRQEPGENLEFLTRARAFDCGCTVLRSAPAMANPETGGHSIVAGPDGKILANAGGVPCVLRCEFNPKARFMRPASYGEPDRIGDYREVIQNACRPELYR